MSRTLVVALFGLCAWAAIVDAQANKAATVSHYAPPRTPWGDPDLQGIYTNKSELTRRSSGRRNSKAGASKTSRSRSYPRSSSSVRRRRSTGQTVPRRSCRFVTSLRSGEAAGRGS